MATRKGVRLCVCERAHMCESVRERATAAPVLMASLRPVAAAVQIEWSPVVIALTEGGLLYSATVCGAGRRAVGHSIHNPQSTGRVWSFQFSSFFPFSGWR